MNAHVRRAVPADAASIAATHIRTWQTAYRGQLPDRYLDELDQELPRRTEFWQTHISIPPARTETWVASDATELMGFVALGPARHEETTAFGEIYAIYVEPRAWNQGLGRILMAQAVSRLASLAFSQAILWVLESNVRARRFYELAGWALDSSKTETLPGGIVLREVCYRKTLQPKKEE